MHGVELDLHHNILAPEARTRGDAALLLQRLQPSRWSARMVLAPTDQILHSASHLFYNSELRDRLRDWTDLDGLLRHCGADPAFWDKLVARTRELGLGESLDLALHFTSGWRRPTPLRLLLPHWLQKGAKAGQGDNHVPKAPLDSSNGAAWRSLAWESGTQRRRAALQVRLPQHATHTASR